MMATYFCTVVKKRIWRVYVDTKIFYQEGRKGGSEEGKKRGRDKMKPIKQIHFIWKNIKNEQKKGGE